MIMCVHVFRDQWDAVSMYYQTFLVFRNRRNVTRASCPSSSRTVTPTREQRGSRVRGITHRWQCYYFTSPRTVQTTQGSLSFETVTSFVNITSLPSTTIDDSYENISLSVKQPLIGTEQFLMACLRRDNRVIAKRTSDQVSFPQNEETQALRSDHQTFIGKYFN